MPTTFYGVRVRQQPMKRYAVSSAVAPILSGQASYAVRVEQRELVVVEYPVTLPYYSVRKGHEEEEVRAKRRGREFMASLIAPETLAPLERVEFIAALDDVLAASREQLLETDIHETERPGIVSDRDVLMLSEIEGSRQAKEPTVQLSEPLEGSTHGRVEEATLSAQISASASPDEVLLLRQVLDEVNRKERTFDTVSPDAWFEAEGNNPTLEADLSEFDDFTIPFRLTEEQTIDDMSRNIVTYATHDSTIDRVDRSTDPMPTHIDDISNHRMNDDPLETTLDAPEAVDHKHEAAAVMLSTADVSTYQQRTFETNMQDITETIRDNTELTELSLTDQTERVTTDNPVSLESTDESIRNIRVFETSEEETGRADRTMTFEVLEAGPAVGSRLDEVLEVLESSAMEAVRQFDDLFVHYEEQIQVKGFQKEEEVLLDDLIGAEGARPDDEVILDEATTSLKTSKEYLTLLTEISDFDSPARPAEESVLYDAARQTVTTYADQLDLDTHQRVESIESVEETTFFEVSRQETSMEVLVETISAAEAARMFEAAHHELETSILSNPVIEAMLEGIDSGESSRLFDTYLDDLGPVEKGAKAATLDDPDTASRSVMVRLDLLGHDEATTTVKPITLDEPDHMATTVKDIVLDEHHEVVRHRPTFTAIIGEFLDAVSRVKKKKKIWLIPSRANHWNPLSHWKKTR